MRHAAAAAALMLGSCCPGGAGDGGGGGSGDSGTRCPAPVIASSPAFQATELQLPVKLERPVSLAVSDDGGVLAIADSHLEQVIEFTANGSLVAVFGSGATGYVDGPAAAAEFSSLLSVEIGSAGRVLAGEICHLRRLDLDSGVMTLAGSGALDPLGQCAVADGTAGDGGGSAGIALPMSVVEVDAGMTYFTDVGTMRAVSGGKVTTLVRRLYFSTMAVTSDGFLTWDGRELQSAAPSNPCAAGDVACGTTTLLAGGEATGYSDGLTAPPAGVAFGGLFEWQDFGAITRCPDGKVYLADPVNNAIRFYDPDAGRVGTLLGAGPDCWLDGGPGSGVLDHPLGVACDGQGNVYIADTGHARILVGKP